MKTERILLIGFMGVGKSTLGNMLSSELQLPFVDLDVEIERSAGRTISEIFAREGEDYFRRLEQSTLKQVIASFAKVVVATGGGLPCYDDNLAYMQKHGTTIYLAAPAKALAERLKARISKRPILASKGDNLLQHISDLLTTREEFYRRATLIVDLELADSKMENMEKVCSVYQEYRNQLDDNSASKAAAG